MREKKLVCYDEKELNSKARLPSRNPLNVQQMRNKIHIQTKSISYTQPSHAFNRDSFVKENTDAG